jgi:hypothetical protein
MARLIPQKQIQIDVQSNFENDISFFKDVTISGSLIVSQSMSIGSSESDTHLVTGSLLIQGDIVSDGNVSVQTLDIYDRLVFKADTNYLFTSQSNDTQLIIGNQYNDYEYTQTTTFKNADVIVSGSLSIVDGILILEDQRTEPTPIIGGIYYSSGSFYYAS